MSKVMLTAVALAVLTFVACKGEEAPATGDKAEPTTAEAPKEAAAGEGGDAPAEKPAEGSAGGDAAKGEATYTKVCVACHGPDGKGNGGLTAPDFTKDDRFTKPDSELLQSIAEGKTGKVGAMPAQKGVLSDEEMKDVLAYMRSKFGS